MGFDDVAKLLEKMKEVEKVSKEVKETLAALESDPRGSLKKSTTHGKAFVKELQSATKELERAKKESEELEESLEKVQKTTSDVGEGFDELKTGMGSLGDMLKAPPKDLRSAAKGAQAWSTKMKGIAGAAEAGKIQLGGMAKMATKLGGLVGGVSKVMLGWPGLIIMGAKALLDAGVQIDSYLKNMNKRYAAIRGPQIMTSDVNNQFITFNKAIVDIAANLRDGLQSGQVYDFMQSITEAGAQLSSLNQGFYSYRDAVHIAAKASKNLGVDVVSVGSMMGDMMQNMRMDLESVDKAFVEVAFDAEKSGMSTDKFWSSVKNATASLAFYGKFLKEISNTTKVFTQAQIGGADQAATTAEEITQAFQKSSTQTNMAFIQLARNGGASFKKIFKNVQNEAEKEVKGITQQLTLKEAKANKTEEDVKAINDLKLKLVNAQRKSDRLAQAAHNGDVAMGQELAMVTGESPGLIMDMIKGINGINFSTQQTGEGLEAIEQAVVGASKGAIGKDAVRYFVELAHQGAAQVKMSAKSLKFEKKDLEGQKKFVAGLGDLTELQSKSPAELTSMAKTMSELYGVSEDEAKKMLWSASTNDKTFDATKKLLAVGTDTSINGEEALKTFNEMVDKQDAGATITKKSLKEQAADSKDTQKAYDDTFAKIRDNTLSLEDMKTIAADGVKYNLASLKFLSNMSTGISKLVGHFMEERIKDDLQKQGLAASQDIQDSFPEIAKELHNNNPATVVKRLEDMNKNVQKQIEQTSNMSDIISGIGGASEVTDKIAELQEKKKTEDPAKFAASGNEDLLNKLIEINAGIQGSKKELNRSESMTLIGLEDIVKKLEEKQKAGNKLTPFEEKQLVQVKKQTDDLLKKGFLKSTQKAKDDNNKIIEDGKNLLTKNDKIITNLTSMDASAAETAKLLEVSTLSDPEKMKTLLGIMGGDSGEITEQALGKYGETVSAAVKKLAVKSGAVGADKNFMGIKKENKYDTNKIISAIKKDSKIVTDNTFVPPPIPTTEITVKPPVGDATVTAPADLKTETKITKAEKGPKGETKKGQMATRAGLVEPETVTKAGAVILHPNETILPPDFNDFQTRFLPKPEPEKKLPIVNKDFDVPDWFKNIDKLEIKKPEKEKPEKKSAKSLAVKVDVPTIEPPNVSIEQESTKEPKQTPVGKPQPIAIEQESTDTDIQKVFKNSFTDTQKEIAGITQELKAKEATAKTPDDVKAIKELKNKLLKAQKKSDSIAIALSKKNVGKLQEIGNLNQQSPELMKDLVDSSKKEPGVKPVKKPVPAPILKSEKEPKVKPAPAPVVNVEVPKKPEPASVMKPEMSSLNTPILKAFEAYGKPLQRTMQSIREGSSDTPIEMSGKVFEKSNMLMQDSAVQIKDLMSQISAVVPKETIMPPNYDAFKTKPMMMAPDKNAQVKTQTQPPANITITVNANTKDLATVIANGVNEVLYKNQIHSRG